MTDGPATTPSQTVGPFLSIVLPWPDGPDLVTSDGITIVGTLTDGAGDPVPDGLIELWQADPNGHFPHPADPQHARYEGFRPFGRCPTDAAGEFRFRTLKPGRVDAEQAPHIDVTVFARGLLRQLVTRLYFPDESSANASDPVLQALPADLRDRLVAVEDRAGLRFDICLQGERETPFFAV
jgi:protocatechuate 3,4-dioxygenase alpha subunit